MKRLHPITLHSHPLMLASIVLANCRELHAAPRSIPVRIPESTVRVCENEQLPRRDRTTLDGVDHARGPAEPDVSVRPHIVLVASHACGVDPDRDVMRIDGGTVPSVK